MVEEGGGEGGESVAVVANQRRPAKNGGARGDKCLFLRGSL